jgi:hypothetical protein
MRQRFYGLRFSNSKIFLVSRRSKIENEDENEFEDDLGS